MQKILVQRSGKAPIVKNPRHQPYGLSWLIGEKIARVTIEVKINRGVKTARKRTFLIRAGQQTLETIRQHLESLVAKFKNVYRLLEEAVFQREDKIIDGDLLLCA